jgi:hypothetical protein
MIAYGRGGFCRVYRDYMISGRHGISFHIRDGELQ